MPSDTQYAQIAGLSPAMVTRWLGSLIRVNILFAVAFIWYSIKNEQLSFHKSAITGKQRTNVKAMFKTAYSNSMKFWKIWQCFMFICYFIRLSRSLQENIPKIKFNQIFALQSWRSRDVDLIPCLTAAIMPDLLFKIRPQERLSRVSFTASQ